jgi:hypothetical protein
VQRPSVTTHPQLTLVGQRTPLLQFRFRVSMFSPRLVLPWRERLHRQDEQTEASALKKKKCLAKIHRTVHNLATDVFLQKEKTDKVKRDTEMARRHAICENGKNHFQTKARLQKIAEMAINPADRELFARLYSRTDEKIWKITETRAWYDSVWSSPDLPKDRCATAQSVGLVLPSHRDSLAERQRPTRAHTARSSLGRRYMQVSTHFAEAWPEHTKEN